MRRVEGPQTPYEVYCYQCRVTFPAEARRCVHCGQRLSARGAAEVPHGLGEPLTAAEALEPGPLAGQDEPDETLATVRRFGVPAVWALVAVSAVLSNMCEGR